MAENLRTFIGVPIRATPALRRVIAELDSLGKPLKAVSPDNLHITLKFLGDTHPQDIAAVGQALTAAADGKSACASELVGVGAFPHAHRPSVVWAGLQNAQVLIDLASELERRLAELGFPREQRAFQPHLTLARVRTKPPPQLAKLLAANSETHFGAVRIESAILYQSELGPQGARYTPLATANLQP
jgi:2'-5' RNA ligase